MAVVYDSSSLAHRAAMAAVHAVIECLCMSMHTWGASTRGPIVHEQVEIVWLHVYVVWVCWSSPLRLRHHLPALDPSVLGADPGK